MNRHANDINERPLVSVIVPVYNVEGYLRRCIDSILDQTYDNFEVILINDGSTDSSGMICNEYEQKDDRVFVTHTSNHGLSAARNLGLQQIHGEWIIYVDSDDYLGPNHILNLLSTAIGSGSLMAVTGSSVSLATEDSLEPPAATPTLYEILDASDAMYTAISSYRLPFAVHAWGKIYAASLAPFLIYPEGKYFEDQFVTYRVMHEAKNVAYENANDYYYTVFRDSSICGKRDHKFLDALEAQQEVIAFTKKENLPRVEALVTSKRYGQMIGLFSAASLYGQKDLADHVYQMIEHERIEAIQTATTATSTKIAMALSFLPRPLFEAITRISAKQYETEFEKNSVKEYEAAKKAHQGN